jgi:hypothetical protein
VAEVTELKFSFAMSRHYRRRWYFTNLAAGLVAWTFVLLAVAFFNRVLFDDWSFIATALYVTLWACDGLCVLGNKCPVYTVDSTGVGVQSVRSPRTPPRYIIKWADVELSSVRLQTKWGYPALRLTMSRGHSVTMVYADTDRAIVLESVVPVLQQRCIAHASTA